MQVLETRIKTVEDKIQQLVAKVAKLKEANIQLTEENTELRHQVEINQNIAKDQALLSDPEVFTSKILLAKKIKREAEQSLRDAERKLESIRF
jgi:FtsZ-binding cell division protein ZapB